MRLGKILVLLSLVHFLILCSSVAATDEGAPPEHYYQMENFINEVLLRTREYFPDWADELDKTFLSSNFSGIRLHASPFEERQLNRRRRSWLFFWKSVPRHLRPSEAHLNIVEAIAEDVRGELCLQQSCGGNRYPWTEEKLSQFEKAVLERLESLVGEFESRVQAFHEDHRPPSQFEQERLLQEYLEIWTLGALLEVESVRFLSAFPMPAPHRERLNERHDPASRQIGGCRIALIRMADEKYRW